MRTFRGATRGPRGPESLAGANFVLVLLTAIACTWGIVFAERIPANGGLGWDGVTYATYIRKLDSREARELAASRVGVETVGETHGGPSVSPGAPSISPNEPAPRARGVPPYYFHRLAPVVVVHLVLRVFQLEPTNANIILAFAGLNAIALLVATFLWGRILDLSGIAGWAKLIGYAALFVNFASLKVPFYDPVLMDTASFLVAVVLLYFHRTRRPAWLWLATLAGTFTHPWLLYVGTVLFLLPHDPPGLDPAPPPPSRLDRLVVWGIVLAAAVVPWTVLLVTWLRSAEPREPIGLLRPLLLGLGGALVVAYLRATLGSLIRVREWWEAARRVLARHRVRWIVVAASLLAIQLVIATFAVGKPISPLRQIVVMAWCSIANPLVFVVSHVWYFGPFLLLNLLCWRDVVAVIRSLGVGLAVIAVLQFLAFLDSESRRVIVFLPFAGLFAIQAMIRRGFHPAFYGILLGLSFVMSRVWLPLRIDPETPASGPGFAPFEFPWQWFFMNWGPWLSDRVYAIGLILTIVATIVLARTARRLGSDPTA